MESFFSRYKNALVLIVVLLGQLLGLAVQVRRTGVAEDHDGPNTTLLRSWAVAAVSPFEKAFLFFGHGVRGTWSNYIDLRNTRQQNKDLQAEINRLRMQEASLAEDARQGQRLQALLAFKQQYIYKTLTVQIIGTGGTDQSHVLYIDRGLDSGLKPDMPVITPDGVVGKVRDVFAHTAQVLEISDQSSGAGVVLEKTRIRGILRGNAFGQPQIINVLPDERIQVGERVLTSGGDQVFPRGLLVGTVERVANDPDHDPYVDVLVKPAANLARLEEVLVITELANEMPAFAQKDIALSEVLAEANKKASDVLAERLPGVNDDADSADGIVGAKADDGKPGSDTGLSTIQLKPAIPLRPDRFSTVNVPTAEDLQPGAAYAKPEHVERPAEVAPKKAAVKKPEDGGDGSEAKPAGTVKPAVRSGGGEVTGATGAKTPATAKPGGTAGSGLTGNKPTGTVTGAKPAGVSSAGTTAAGADAPGSAGTAKPSGTATGAGASKPKAAGATAGSTAAKAAGNSVPKTTAPKAGSEPPSKLIQIQPPLGSKPPGAGTKPATPRQNGTGAANSNGTATKPSVKTAPKPPQQTPTPTQPRTGGPQ